MKFKYAFFVFSILFLSEKVSVYAQSEEENTSKIESFLAKKRAYNKHYGFGYRIQLYNGNENIAKKLKAKFEIEFPDIKTYLSYQSPEWKIQVGNYKTKLEADKALLTFSQKFSSIIVIPLANK